MVMYDTKEDGRVVCLRCSDRPVVNDLSHHNGIHNAMVRIKHTLEYATEEDRKRLLVLFNG